MRFIQDGPNIPNELLIARDKGRVFFFCGAGVSKAFAKLPDFYDLANTVINKLNVMPDDKIYRLMKEIDKFGSDFGELGLISIDRVFGLLERDFLEKDIEGFVANALRPSKVVNFKAHNIILKLSTTVEDRVQLVTTNFDLLFEDCQLASKVIFPPKLPDPQIDLIDGIVHIHGCVTNDYKGAMGSGFILSPSQFGQAYLSDGWATQFISKILENYIVVFIGYSANDPPIQYLLEGLSKKRPISNRIYAFQDDLNDNGNIEWEHKGVIPISYHHDPSHSALWKTLESWAERAENPTSWYDKVIDLAQKGPKNLRPHERGQIAHMVSTLEGAQRFVFSTPPPPPEWLLVFDVNRRYANPENSPWQTEEEVFVDPFELYGLDSDPVPSKSNSISNICTREIPDYAWDAFTVNKFDEKYTGNTDTTIRKKKSLYQLRPPQRLLLLGRWIAENCHHVETIWWASHQLGIPQDVRNEIEFKLTYLSGDNSDLIRSSWSYLFEFWANFYESIEDKAKFLNTLLKDGWTPRSIRFFVNSFRPRIKVGPPIFRQNIPPDSNEIKNLHDIIDIKIEYPEIESFSDDIPNEFLMIVVRNIRYILEYSSHLENELYGYIRYFPSPIIPDNSVNGIPYERTHGLSGLVIFYSLLFARLINYDLKSAREEFRAWPLLDNLIFTRLRIWAGSYSSIITANAFSKFIHGLSDDDFWISDHARDILLALKSRWKEFSVKQKQTLVNRILKGRPNGENASVDTYNQHKAWSSLNRLQWLVDNDCELTPDIYCKINDLKRIAPDWRPEYAKNVAKSLETIGGVVKVNMDTSDLIHLSARKLLIEIDKRSGLSGDFPVEIIPLAGLSKKKPLKVFRALNMEFENKKFNAQHWRTFLNYLELKDNRFLFLLAERFSKYPNVMISEILSPLTFWLRKNSEGILSNQPQSFMKLFTKLLNILSNFGPEYPLNDQQDFATFDWLTAALNSPAGYLSECLLKYEFHTQKNQNRCLTSFFHTNALKILSLPGDLRRHAIALFTRNLYVLYYNEPDWVKNTFLSILKKENIADISAFWCGFLWGNPESNQNLFILLKPHLFELSKQYVSIQKGILEPLTQLILSGWNTTMDDNGDPLILNDELHQLLIETNNDFRCYFLIKTKQAIKLNSNAINERIPELFENVWPRQKKLKNKTISAHLLNILFLNETIFIKLVDVIEPLLSEIGFDYYFPSVLFDDRNSILDLHPNHVIVVLSKVLSPNSDDWPHRTVKIIDRIRKADMELIDNPRFKKIMSLKKPLVNKPIS